MFREKQVLCASLIIFNQQKNIYQSISNCLILLCSLNDDVYQTPPPMPHHEFSNEDILPKTKEKNMTMMYYTSNNTNQLDNMAEQILMKKKTMVASSSKKNSQSEPSSSSSDKRLRRFWHKEGQQKSNHSYSFFIQIDSFFVYIIVTVKGLWIKHEKNIHKK